MALSLSIGEAKLYNTIAACKVGVVKMELAGGVIVGVKVGVKWELQ